MHDAGIARDGLWWKTKARRGRAVRNEARGAGRDICCPARDGRDAGIARGGRAGMNKARGACGGRRRPAGAGR